ncbi:MAG: M50 family metallopeptidase [Deltaproteobacteria bacterium]|nr:M50 family metallopeptidase [Deltaproteobacteria bacterium]
MRVLLAALGIGFLIAFHELGHYAVARLLGMRVLRYSLGFGPKLFGFRRGGIEYQLAALPFGGFVQIAGMSSMDEAAKDDPRSFLNAPRWKRWLVLAAGPGFNYLAAFFFFFVYFSAWPSPIAARAFEISAVHEGPAKAAGLLPGEFVTKINGIQVEEQSNFIDAIVASEGAPLTFTVLNISGPEQGTRDIVIAAAEVAGGWKVGVSPPEIRKPSEGLFENTKSAAAACLTTSIRTLQALQALVQRKPGVDVGGPIAIVASMKDQIALGVRQFVLILATLSVSLGLFNLLPVPGLDGIKMLFLTIEGVVRRNVNLKFQEIVNAIGVLLLLVLMAGLTVRDGFRLFG